MKTWSKLSFMKRKLVIQNFYQNKVIGFTILVWFFWFVLDCCCKDDGITKWDWIKRSLYHCLRNNFIRLFCILPPILNYLLLSFDILITYIILDYKGKASHYRNGEWILLKNAKLYNNSCTGVYKPKLTM